MVYTLYNSTAGAHYVSENLMAKMQSFFKDEEVVLTDALEISDKEAYISRLTADDKLVVVGGDGTLNRFANAIADREYPFPIYCYAGGTGNDFLNDIATLNSDEPHQINEYLHKLPVVTVNGKSYKFLNGIGYGIDGYCCEEGDRQRAKNPSKSPNYTKIAIKGLLGAFKPRGAKITIDGVTHEYKNVWMAPTMNGRYFGGGMKITPDQDRLNEERELSIAVVTCKSRLRLLTIFPKIFKGEHVKYEKQVKIFKGKDIHIEFETPCALQIDGETICGVKEYSAKSSALIKEQATV